MQKNPLFIAFLRGSPYSVGVYQRILEIDSLLKKKSFFLFGPRSTGKTTLIETIQADKKVYDLLRPEVYKLLQERPQILEEENPSSAPIIVIDEIQKHVRLLDMVQFLIGKGYKFLLTGSSARRLKRGSANLLAGRAWMAELFPLVSREIPEFSLVKYLNRGGLPQIYDSPDYKEDLLSYVSLYLREEVQNESLVRHVGPFSEALELIARSNGEEINYDKLSNDLQISPNTVRNYIDILDDTLLGFKLEAYTKTKKRKAISRSKYYLFDIGVTNALCYRGDIAEKSELFGKAFEHFIVLEIRAFLSYSRLPIKMFYWRAQKSQREVDVIIGDQLAIEVKSTYLVQDKHLKSLRCFKEEGLVKSHIVVSLDESERLLSDGIRVLPWRVFLDKLWSGQFIEPAHM